jgi:DNA-binding MarR family transcriptional regulator
MEMKDAYLTLEALLKEVSEKHERASQWRLTIGGLTPSQAHILLFLRQNGASKVSVISKSLAMVDSNVSNICSRLEKMGFATRTRQLDDNRVVVVGLTEAAAPKIESLILLGRYFHQKMRELVSREDITLICESLMKLNSIFDAFLQDERLRGL